MLRTIPEGIDGFGVAMGTFKSVPEDGFIRFYMPAPLDFELKNLTGK